MGYGPAIVLGLAIIMGANDIAQAVRSAQINMVIKFTDEISKPDGNVRI